jgi:hypothetical protein
MVFIGAWLLYVAIRQNRHVVAMPTTETSSPQVSS